VSESAAAAIAKREAWATPRIRDALRARYAAPAWALVQEVPDSTGFANRVCDGLAFSCWRSATAMHGARGGERLPYEVHGFEIKASRADWLRELKQPAKTDEFRRHCHRWWLVTGHHAIAKPEELPLGWGMLVPRGESLWTVVPAPLAKPEPIGGPFLAALARRMVEQSWEAQHVRSRVAAARRESVWEALADVRAALEHDIRWATKEGKPLEGAEILESVRQVMRRHVPPAPATVEEPGA
jgi:hypothetical protein